MGAPGMSTPIADFNGENFDHSGLGFFGGGYFVCSNGGAPPIGGRLTPRGSPRRGGGWKEATLKWDRANPRFNTHGPDYAHRAHCTDLGSTSKDTLGRPV